MVPAGLTRTDQRGYSFEKRKAYNDGINAISRLAARIAGGTSKLYDMSKEDRMVIRTTAARMHELGMDYGQAASVESTIREGFVYAITNPSFPGYVKIGRAFDPESRLRGYQTGCPNRSYELEHSVYFADCLTAEKEMHARLEKVRAEGEWFFMTATQATNAINQLREQL